MKIQTAKFITEFIDHYAVIKTDYYDPSTVGVVTDKPLIEILAEIIEVLIDFGGDTDEEIRKSSRGI